jgi:hypothetical protein
VIVWGFLAIGGTANDLEIVLNLGGGSITSAVTQVPGATGGLTGITYTVGPPNEITVTFDPSSGTTPGIPTLPLSFEFGISSSTRWYQDRHGDWQHW